MTRLKVWWHNVRFNVGYRVGGFTSAKREHEKADDWLPPRTNPPELLPFV